METKELRKKAEAEGNHEEMKKKDIPEQEAPRKEDELLKMKKMEELEELEKQILQAKDAMPREKKIEDLNSMGRAEGGIKDREKTYLGSEQMQQLQLILEQILDEIQRGSRALQGCRLRPRTSPGGPEMANPVGGGRRWEA